MATKKRRKRTVVQEALIELRARLNDSQESFAQRLGVSAVTIAVWESKQEPTNTALANLYRVASDKANPQPDLAAVFLETLEELKSTQARKAHDIFDEIARWHEINGHLVAINDEAQRLRKEKLKDTELPQRIVDRLYQFEEVLAAAQRWSWRNR